MIISKCQGIQKVSHLNRICLVLWWECSNFMKLYEFCFRMVHKWVVNQMHLWDKRNYFLAAIPLKTYLLNLILPACLAQKCSIPRQVTQQMHAIRCLRWWHYGYSEVIMASVNWHLESRTGPAHFCWLISTWIFQGAMTFCQWWFWPLWWGKSMLEDSLASGMEVSSGQCSGSNIKNKNSSNQS